MYTPDRAVEVLWQRTITAPATWGRAPDAPGHPFVRGLARAAGVLLVPVGFAVFVVSLVFVLAPVAICYDAVTVLRALAGGADASRYRSD